MVKLLYCWRCEMEIPMLEEHEATDVLQNAHDQNRILWRYFEVTGFEETNANAIWHHVTGLYGAPCSSCGKPLRTSRARMCSVRGSGDTLGYGNAVTLLRSCFISIREPVRLSVPSPAK
jgi:hypothetical protein